MLAKEPARAFFRRRGLLPEPIEPLPQRHSPLLGMRAASARIPFFLHPYIARHRNTNQKEEQMNRVSIALIAISLATSHLMAQRAPACDAGECHRNNTLECVRISMAACAFLPRFTKTVTTSSKTTTPWICIVFGLSLLIGTACARAIHPNQATRTSRRNRLRHHLHRSRRSCMSISWPEQVNTSATFSIVTTSGTVYLATMVWVEGGDVHFNSVDVGVRQIPLSSVSRSLTETANAQKKLNLRLPWTQAATPNIEALPEDGACSAGDIRPFSGAY